jgi:hypothetical protein
MHFYEAEVRGKPAIFCIVLVNLSFCCYLIVNNEIIFHEETGIIP